MHKYFFTFGNYKYHASAAELHKQAEQYVDSAFNYKEEDIPPEFCKLHEKHFADSRGFGYWIWKAYFINQLLAISKDDDIFMYSDAGNSIISDISILYDLCNEDEKGIILFDNSDGNPTGRLWPNSQWTKTDCFNMMGLTDDKYLHGNQVNASYIVFKKTDFSVSFFDEFYKWCTNYHVISDAANITGDHINNEERLVNSDFRDHRHDQSILSLMSIKYNITIDRDPSQWGMIRYSPEAKYKQLFDHHRRGIRSW